MRNTSSPTSVYCKSLIPGIAVVSALLILALLSEVAMAIDNVYMFSYFKDPDGTDGLHLAYSLDGLSFHAVNGDVAITGPMAGTTTRDPCIYVGPDGKFRVVHTTEPWNVNTKIAYGESSDLLTWTNKKYIDVMAAYPGTQRTWAPEIFYDSPNSRYLIYWSADIGSGSGFHTYYTTTSDNFNTFTPTQDLYNPGFSVIDAMIVKDGANHVMFVKDERNGQKFVFKAQGGPNATGPYDTSGGPRISGNYWFEGPTAIKIGDTWYLYGDRYTDNPQRMGLLTSSDDMQTWTERRRCRLPLGHQARNCVYRFPRSGRKFNQQRRQ